MSPSVEASHSWFLQFWDFPPWLEPVPLAAKLPNDGEFIDVTVAGFGMNRDHVVASAGTLREMRFAMLDQIVDRARQLGEGQAVGIDILQRELVGPYAPGDAQRAQSFANAGRNGEAFGILDPPRAILAPAAAGRGQRA